MRNVMEATSRDLEVVRRQIGREPRGMIAVSKRCRFGYPQVVVTKPLHYSDSSSIPWLFPTTYWLSCPHLCKSVSALESRRLIETFRSRVRTDSEFSERLAARHEQYAGDRVSLVSEDELERLRTDHPNMYKRLVKLGIGGIRHVSGVKCLHLHLADYLSGGDNPVGEEVCRLLAGDGISLECDAGLCCGCQESAAVLNVGSNSVKLLVARPRGCATRGCCLHEVLRRIVVTRLAEGLMGGSQGQKPVWRLRREAIARTVDAVADLIAEAREYRPSTLVVFGTAAVRQSANRSELIAAIRDRTGLDPLVISEQQEAELSFASAVSVLQDSFDTCILMAADIGGASTEITLGRGRSVIGSTSVELGALTALTVAGVEFDTEGRLQSSRVTELRHKTSQILSASGQDLLARTREIAVVGGSVTALVALMLGLDEHDPEAIHGFRVSYDSAVAMLRDLCERTRKERLEMRGMLDRERIDSIIGGVAILVSLMEIARADHVVVSEHGVLEGMACLVLFRR